MVEKIIESKNKLTLSWDLSIADITSKNISEKIFSLIEFSSQINSKSDQFKELKEIILLYFARLIERRKDLDLLKSYYNDDILRENKLIWKVEKNIMIYLPLLINYVYNNKKWKSDEEVKNLINISFKKMIILFFIYWDKTSMILFSETLKLDISTLKEKEKEFIEKQKKIQNDEELIKWNLTISHELTVNDLFSRTYRTIIEKTDEKCIQSWVQNSKSKIMNQIAEKEIMITYEWLYNLFIKTMELDLSLNIRLNKIKEAFILLFWLVNSFKENWILDPNFLLIESKKFDNKFFKLFIDWIESNNFDLKLFIFKFRNEKPWFRNEKTKKTISEDDFSKIKLHWLSEEVWLSFTTDQKYLFFINNVLWLDNWNIKIYKNLWFWSQSIKTLVSDFVSQYNYEKDWVEQKVEFFKSWRTFVLFDFIRTDIDKFIFLYNWFEFLTLRWDWKRKSKIKRPDFLRDIIRKLKEEKEVDESEYLNLKGDLYNLSAVNIWKQIDFLFRDLSRWNSQILWFNIWKISFKDNVWLYSLSDKSDIWESLNYLNIAINACISVLNWRNLSKKQWNYIKKLQELWLLPDNLANIKINDRDNLIKLISWLKIVKWKIEKLQQMQEVSNNDISIVADLFSQVWINTDNYDDRTWNKIWPEKDFWRILIKLIKNYNWDFHKIWDLNRFRLIWEIWIDNENSMDQLIKKIIKLKSYDWVKNVSFENEAWHLLSNPDKKTAYRDFKANILLSSWNLVEVQIHFKEMIEKKAWDYDLDSSVKYSLENRNSLLISSEVIEFIKLYNQSFDELPSENLLLSISNLNEQQLKEYKLWTWQINCDKLYKITRWLDPKTSLAFKLTMLERTLFNNEWALVVTKNLSKIWIKFKNGNVIKK